MKDVIVIGGGISGLQAGIFTSKAGEDTLVLDTGESLVKNTSNIQNLLGFDSISGHELLKRGKEKLKNFSGKFKEEKVVKVEKTQDLFEVKTEENTYKAEYLIVATAENFDFLKELDIEYEEGKNKPFLMDKHLKTDEKNKVSERIYAAGLSATWEYQVSIAIGEGAKAAVNLLTDKNEEPFTDHDT